MSRNFAILLFTTLACLMFSKWLSSLGFFVLLRVTLPSDANMGICLCLAMDWKRSQNLRQYQLELQSLNDDPNTLGDVAQRV